MSNEFENIRCTRGYKSNEPEDLKIRLLKVEAEANLRNQHNNLQSITQKVAATNNRLTALQADKDYFEKRLKDLRSESLDVEKTFEVLRKRRLNDARERGQGLTWLGEPRYHS